MKANQYRSGNLVKGNKFSIPREGISSDGTMILTAYGIYMIECEKLKVEPVKLTKEWVLKLGFKENRPWTFDKGKKGEWSTTLDGFSTDKGSEGFRLEWCEGRLCFELYYHYEEIKTVHRLQNLYFALTGTELILK